MASVRGTASSVGGLHRNVTGGVTRLTSHETVHGVASGPVIALDARASNRCAPSDSPITLNTSDDALNCNADDVGRLLRFLHAAAPSSRTSTES